MKKWLDYYSILQVHHEAEPEIIIGAYKKLCKKYHPDVNNSFEAEEKMKLINIAYEVLSDTNKRNRFHREWLNNNKKSHSNVPKMEINNFYAYKVINHYFNCISNKEYKKAYSLISQYDKNSIVLTDFIEWQEAVSKLYKIGNIKISEFKFYKTYNHEQALFNQALEYELEVKEKNLTTNKVYNYIFTKIVVRENNTWKILLGYSDLKKYIEKYKFMADKDRLKGAVDFWLKHKDAIDEDTGLMNKKGFMKKIPQEIERYKRYGYIFSLCMIRFNASSIGNKALNEQLKILSYIIENNIRSTDFAARFDDNTILILLHGTDEISGIKAEEKLIRVIQSSPLADTNLINIYSSVVEHIGNNINNTINKCIKKLKISGLKINKII